LAGSVMKVVWWEWIGADGGNAIVTRHLTIAIVLRKPGPNHRDSTGIFYLV
jgi:hypothetical protein